MNLETIKTNVIDFLENKFTFKKELIRGFLLTDSSNNAIMIDYQICNKTNPFKYNEYTKEQNSLMSQYDSIYRFLIDDEKDFEEFKSIYSHIQNNDFNEDNIKQSGTNRELKEIDPTLPEAYFEQAFIECYGRESLSKIRREFPFIDMNGQTRYTDYYLKNNCYSIAIEKNGEKFHHPILTGEKKYNSQLFRQNSLVAYGFKVFRWSLEGMKTTDNFYDEVKKFIGNLEDLHDLQKLSVTRQITLLNHQIDSLKELEQKRNDGEKNFLVVLPTGTGKTEILIADILEQYQKDNSLKILILVPTKQLKIDTIKKVNHRFENELHVNVLIGEEKNSQILIQTYSWMSRYYQNFNSLDFNYIAVDEAHHAVAPTLQKVIQYFNPQMLLGLTATDKRLDEKSLAAIFGKYESSLTLVEAINQDILAPIKAFRVKSNIDLSEVRFNGKDYYSTDLQKTVIAPSRDQLIVDVLKKYFANNSMPFKSGLIFCVSVIHAKKVAKLLRENKISCEAVSGNDNNSQKYIEEYQNGKIQFLTTCSLLNEGWDSPRTSIIVMARPTMSKVLYTQQIGRGTRKYEDKEALYVIDIVDNYGGAGTFKNTPWSIHALLGIANYKPWADMLNSNKLSHEEILLDGLYEEERKLEYIDIFTFEEKYADYLSDEQLARELYVSTGTLRAWVKKNEVIPDVQIPIGKQFLNYYEPLKIEAIRKAKNLKVHNDETIYKDFFEFIEEGTYSLSYKMIFIFSFFKTIDHNGEVNLDDLVTEFKKFYQYRVDKNLKIDRNTSPFENQEFINDNSSVKQNILANPFEKFERKRFMYHCKDLNNIAFSNILWNQINNTSDIQKIKKKFFDDLVNYYKELGSFDVQFWKKYWDFDL
ncbi:MAG: DEAD/DEAH box helicase [Sulfurospirillaceae bacterium]|nr:DEAD/DEAH box helicase [Sulfurospirillaceae bacterium]